MKFVADTMLGRLAKWLRVLGYDTHYRSHYRMGELSYMIGEGRRLITRDGKKLSLNSHALFLHSETVGEQLSELTSMVGLRPDPAGWFLRCIRCNALLEPVPPSRARERVPEYVFYQNRDRIKVCCRCGRYFWPGSHRRRMVEQLAVWGWFHTPQK